jgi:hypothetical protein
LREIRSNLHKRIPYFSEARIEKYRVTLSKLQPYLISITVLILTLLLPSIIAITIFDLELVENYGKGYHYSISNMLWSYYYISVDTPIPPNEDSGYFIWIYLLATIFQTQPLIIVFLTFIVFGPRLFFVFMIFRYYKRRTSSLHTIATGLIAEFFFWYFSSPFWTPPISPLFITLYLKIPTLFAFIFSLILMNIIPPSKPQEKTETKTDVLEPPLVETN